MDMASRKGWIETVSLLGCIPIFNANTEKKMYFMLHIL